MKSINFFLGIMVLIFILLVGYWAVTPNTAPLWTGFGAYDATAQGARAKTLWDWLDLLVVPFFLAIGAYLLSLAQKASEMNTELDRQRQNTLISFIDQISKLLVDKKLRTARVNSEIRSLARTYTRVALRNLDGNRKSQLLQFLSESGLIARNPVISLMGSNLTNSDLSNANLMRAEIKGARFTNSLFKNANLSYSNFCGCDFSNSLFDGATLEGVDMSYAILKSAKLRNLDLTKTNLDWANLEGADLTNTKITKEQIQNLETTLRAKLPQPVKFTNKEER